MIETYWNEMFGEFKNGDRQFSLPGLPEPLMSPHFGVKNLVTASPRDSLRPLTLCLFQAKDSAVDATVKHQDLNEAIKEEIFWEFTQKHHPESYPFMKVLLPFLVKHQKPHRHFYIKQDQRIIASCLVGEAKSCVFSFNAAVAKDFRQKGIQQILLKSIQAYHYPKPVFYWTKLAWLTNGADEVLYYHHA